MNISITKALEDVNNIPDGIYSISEIYSKLSLLTSIPIEKLNDNADNPFKQMDYYVDNLIKNQTTNRTIISINQYMVNIQTLKNKEILELELAQLEIRWAYLLERLKKLEQSSTHSIEYLNSNNEFYTLTGQITAIKFALGIEDEDLNL